MSDEPTVISAFVRLMASALEDITSATTPAERKAAEEAMAVFLRSQLSGSKR